MYVSTATRTRGRRRLLVAVVVACATVATLVIAAGALALTEGDALPARTVVGGVDVGRLSAPAAGAALVAAAREQRLRAVSLRLDDAGSPVTVTVTGALLGAQPRIDDALAEADRVSLLSRLTRRLGFGETQVVPLQYDFDDRQLERLRTDLDGRIAAEPQNATLTVTAQGARVAPSVTGRTLDADALMSRLSHLPQTVTVPVTVVRPEVTTAAARRAARTVDMLLSRPRTVAIGTVAVRLSRPFLRRALVIEPVEGALNVTLDTEMLGRRLRPAFGDRLRHARNAEFRVTGTRIEIVSSAPGRELDVVSIGRSLLSNPRSAVHRARFRSVAPALTTEAARGLGIKELVSEFTTYYPCCAPRVSNIQRAAQLLDGTVIRSGGTFSLNEALGERTVEKGFVSAPQILRGRLEDAVGGGISQVATTLYNAAFFAGLRLDAHQPHQFYISRYPMGREATVSWGGPELVFTNDWKAGLLLKVSAWSTGISVRFYSSKLGRRVETVTDEPYSYRAPVTRLSKNPALRPGERKVVQEAGGSGFTVEYTRKVFRGDEVARDERFRVRYDAQNAFIEIGPKKKPKPKPGEKPPTPADPGAGDTDTTPPQGDDAADASATTAG